MPSNVEIKARVTRIEDIEPRVRLLCGEEPQHITQDDTFFVSARGRLKLRDFGDGSGELIHYERDDIDGPKQSRYVLAPTSSPAALRLALENALGISGRVRKSRLLYMLGRTRVHLDRVEGLGDFLELEVVLGETESAESGSDEARRILSLLGLGDDCLVAGAYVDLLQHSDHHRVTEQHTSAETGATVS
ncbi:MAG: class IV adenylate cyclase [Ignavibacteriae bacterium]|nr:class IV adenylate cyclase [Ignavibacteriota bacterium]